MEKIISSRRWKPVPKRTPWGIVVATAILLAVLAGILWQAALIGGREAHAAAELLTPASYLATPPGLTDETTIRYYEAPTDTPVWVPLTPGRSGLTN